MPDHVHCLLRPLPLPSGRDCYPLRTITHTAKGFTAKAIGRLRGRGGLVWQDECFDRIVRDREELSALMEYIRGNAVVRALAARPECYPWLLVRPPQDGDGLHTREGH